MRTAELNETSINWAMDDNGRLIISGTKVPDYSCGKNPDAPWDAQKDLIKEIIIQDGVTSIGINAFKECHNLRKVYLPASLRRIYAYAFMNCTSLDKIETSEDNWIYIGEDRKNMQQNTIIFGIESFRNVPWALKKWDNLYISDNCLRVCFSQPDELIIPEGTKSVEPLAFYDYNITRITIPFSMQTIKDSAFCSCTVKKIDFQNTSCHICRQAFINSTVSELSFPRDWDPQIYNCLHFSKTAPRFVLSLEKTNIPEIRKVVIREKKQHIRISSDGTVSAVSNSKLINTGEGMYRKLTAGNALERIMVNDRHVSVQLFIIEKQEGKENSVCRHDISVSCLNENDMDISTTNVIWQKPNKFMDIFHDQYGKSNVDALNLMENQTIVGRKDSSYREIWYWSPDISNFNVITIGRQMQDIYERGD